MDAEQIRQLKPELRRYLQRFEDCFSRRDTRELFSTYVEGQLSDLKEKSCEPIALAAGVPPRNLQEFLKAYKWQEDRARDRLQQMVAREDRGRRPIDKPLRVQDIEHGLTLLGIQRARLAVLGSRLARRLCRVRRRYRVARLTPIARQAAAVPTSGASFSAASINRVLSRRGSPAVGSASRRLFFERR